MTQREQRIADFRAGARWYAQQLVACAPDTSTEVGRLMAAADCAAGIRDVPLGPDDATIEKALALIDDRERVDEAGRSVALGKRLRGERPDGFVWVPTYKGCAWISDERTKQLDRAFNLSRLVLLAVLEEHPLDADPCCLCGGPKSQHENGTGRCTGEGIEKCGCKEFRPDHAAIMAQDATDALAALNELLSPPAKEEPK